MMELYTGPLCDPDASPDILLVSRKENTFFPSLGTLYRSIKKPCKQLENQEKVGGNEMYVCLSVAEQIGRFLSVAGRVAF